VKPEPSTGHLPRHLGAESRRFTIDVDHLDGREDPEPGARARSHQIPAQLQHGHGRQSDLPRRQLASEAGARRRPATLCIDEHGGVDERLPAAILAPPARQLLGTLLVRRSNGQHRDGGLRPNA
jgi:hypothetical protein